MTAQQKHELSTWLKTHIQESGLSQNQFGTSVFEWTPGTTSNVLTKGDVEGKVSDKTWLQIQQYKAAKQGYVGIETPNYKAIHTLCNMAYNVKSAICIEGEGGYGKSYALKKFKDIRTDIKVLYLDIALTGSTGKKVVAEIMRLTGDYKAGSIQTQLLEIRKRLSRENALLILDETSALQGYHVTILKDIMTTLDEVCGIVLSGTHYFAKNLNNGANRNRHLYTETKDRIFMHSKTLVPPTDADAIAIFQANGLTPEQIQIVTGEGKYSWHNKRTYRGIRDAIRLVKMIS